MIDVSIIVPVYNVEPYIERCITSVLAQTYQNLEIIIVDDRGSDNSIDIIKSIIETHPSKSLFKFVYHEKNRGLSCARNSGIHASTGRYLYFLDSDDEITPDCIELLFSQTSLSHPDFIIADYKCIGNSKPMPSLQLNEGVLYNKVDILKSFREQKWYVMAVNKLIKKDFIETNKLYFKENLIHEDILWSFLVACNASTMNVVRSETYIYHLRENSITAKINDNKKRLFQEKSIQSKKEIVDYMFDFVMTTQRNQNIKEINRTYEKYKYLLFFSILQSKCCTLQEMNLIYNEFRSKKIKSARNTFSDNCYSVVSFFKNLHYLFPSFFGFYYCLLIEKFRKYIRGVRTAS